MTGQSNATALTAAVLSAGGGAALFWLLPAPLAAAGMVYTAGLVWLSLIDLRTRRLPDALTLPLMVAGLGVSALGLGPSLVASVCGAAAGYLVIAGLALAYRSSRGVDGIGLGDAKLLAAIGAWIGFAPLPFAVLIAALGGLLFYLVRHAGRRWRGADLLPFGPFLGLAGWLSFVAGHRGIDGAALLLGLFQLR